jgi:cystathionine beta-lyase
VSVRKQLRTADWLAALQVTVSFGGCSSLISLPCFMSHASIPADVRAARGLPDDLVRISAGIEGACSLCVSTAPLRALQLSCRACCLPTDADDLLADLASAMNDAMEATGMVKPAPVVATGSVDTAALMVRLKALEAQLALLNQSKP